jgi:hypothetical protein
MRSNCSICVLNNSDLQHLFLIGCLISRIFFYHCSICVLKDAGVALLGFEHKLRRVVFSASVQDLNTIEQLLQHSGRKQRKFECT